MNLELLYRCTMDLISVINVDRIVDPSSLRLNKIDHRDPAIDNRSFLLFLNFLKKLELRTSAACIGDL